MMCCPTPSRKKRACSVLLSYRPVRHGEVIADFQIVRAPDTSGLLEEECQQPAVLLYVQTTIRHSWDKQVLKRCSGRNLGSFRRLWETGASKWTG